MFITSVLNLSTLLIAPLLSTLFTLKRVDKDIDKMAYDFGSQTLGINNPFKTEGKIRFAAGIVLLVAGVFPLLQVAEALKTDPVFGYTYAALGFIIVGVGTRMSGYGLFQLFKYFVGRSVPTSLAFNLSPSEQQTAQEEKKYTAYKAKDLHSMLMGRKNITFKEPNGWVSRLIHSLFPNLIFLPYQLRILAQTIGSMFINLGTAIICFLVVLFVVLTGMAGTIAQQIMMPVFTLFLLIYLTAVWVSAGRTLTSANKLSMPASGNYSVGALITLSILIPVVLGYLLEQNQGEVTARITAFISSQYAFRASGNLLVLAVTIFLSFIAVVPLLLRLKEVTPQTEVSEHRSNMQESIHPNEIFINIENIVLANRRYKEIPNRVYRNYDPTLDGQADGKGSFSGELLVETQPVLANEQPIEKATNWKLACSVVGQLCIVLSVLFFYLSGICIASLIKAISNSGLNETAYYLINAVLFNSFAFVAFATSGKLLNVSAHLFWGEIRFSSLLMYMKTDGTYTESKISTGMAIHDSTRSENTVVRSSITPWIITSQITSSIFASSGSRNLEAPRLVMGMNKTDAELQKIVDEIVGFLRGRESIASITNEADLQNSSTIHQINEQSRAIKHESGNTAALDKQTEEAAGLLRNDPSRDNDAIS
jgi:hypothetical protein